MAEDMSLFELQARIAEFDRMLDDVEAALQGAEHGLVENLASVEIAQRFVRDCWDHLPYSDQERYQARLAWMRRGRRPAS